MELSIRKKWILLVMGICIICLGSILVYHFYQAKNRPIISKGIFVMSIIDDTVPANKDIKDIELESKAIEELLTKEDSYSIEEIIESEELLQHAFLGEFHGYLH
ncbi:MAG: hypothetical protein GX962_07715 [Epulopiscium sp.]|nr:hypothetical protein [Candidatus Epulonipiscium sp.]